MTIKEVCEKYDITPDTLRYYERVGVIPEVLFALGGPVTGGGAYVVFAGSEHYLAVAAQGGDEFVHSAHIDGLVSDLFIGVGGGTGLRGAQHERAAEYGYDHGEAQRQRLFSKFLKSHNLYQPFF